MRLSLPEGGRENEENCLPRTSAGLTDVPLSEILTDLKVNSRAFQRDFARMKQTAKSGEPVIIVSGGEEFIFQAVKPRTWQGALKGKIKIRGDIFSTGIEWEASK